MDMRSAVKTCVRMSRNENAADWLHGPKHTATVEIEEGKAVMGATVHERLKKSRFLEVKQTDLAELERISLRLLQQMSLRLSRRIRKLAVRGRIDLRRTIRQKHQAWRRFDRSLFSRTKVAALQAGGCVGRKRINESIQHFLCPVCLRVAKYFKRVDTFLFSTQLTEITSTLRARHFRDALESLAGHAAGWSGGTKIGDSLHELNQLQGRRLFSRDTVFMVLSDGWETGDPESMPKRIQ